MIINSPNNLYQNFKLISINKPPLPILSMTTIQQAPP